VDGLEGLEESGKNCWRSLKCLIEGQGDPPARRELKAVLLDGDGALEGAARRLGVLLEEGVLVFGGEGVGGGDGVEGHFEGLKGSWVMMGVRRVILKAFRW
jgi:hypothetical protein